MAFSISTLPFSAFARFDFRVAELSEGVLKYNDGSLPCKDAPSATDEKRILTVKNVEGYGFPVTFKNREGIHVFVRADSSLEPGSPHSTSVGRLVTPLKAVELKSLDLRIGEVVKQTNLSGCIYMDVLMGGDGIKRSIIPDANMSLSLVGKQIVLITNLKPECVHDDIRVHPLCYVREGKTNPFTLTSEVPLGTSWNNDL